MIDLIIPTYNQPEMLADCLASVRRYTTAEYNLVIADDHSPDATMKKVWRGCKVIYNESGTQGFPHNCNWAVSKTKAPLICLLNSDTVAKPLWLDAMLDEMDDPTVGIVGAKLLYPADHPLSRGIQHAGVAHNVQGMPYHIFRGMDRNTERANRRRELNAVTFACVLIRREVWEQVGGLCEDYVGGQFEDIDFCHKARERGWKIVYQPNAVLIHREHGSGEEFVNASSKPNAVLYRQRWGRLGSDEYLFQDVTMDLETVAAVVQMVRSRAMRYITQTPTREHIEHCERVARLPYKNLAPHEQEITRDMARMLLKELGAVL